MGRRSLSAWFLIGLLVTGAAACRTARAQPGPTKRALLIGIDRYERLKALRGCVNDVELMKTLLIGKFEVAAENVMLLENEQATRANILAAIRSHLIEPARPGDIVILHYSGHGSQMPDRSHDELDRWDETLAPYDARGPGVFDISDDEINGLLQELSHKTQNVTFILDSCHSGSAARAVATGNDSRLAPRDERPPPEPEVFARGTANEREGVDDFRLPGANYVLISGCRASELSNESQLGDARHGALTYFLAQALRASSNTTTYRDVMDAVQADVTAHFPDQHPQVEGTGMDSFVFNDRTSLSQPFVLVEPADGGGVTLGAGEVYGVRAGTVLDVYPPGTKLFEGTTPRTARVRIATGDAFQSRGEVVQGGGVQPHSRAVLNAVRPPGFRLQVFIHDVERSPLLGSVRQALEADDAVAITASPADAAVRVRLRAGQVILENRALDVLSDSVRATDPNAQARVVRQILHWGRWFAVLAIDNPSPTVNVRLRLLGTDGAADEANREVVAEGTKITYTVTNLSNEPLHVTVLDLDSGGSVSVLHPPPGVEDALAPGKSLQRTLEAGLPVGRESAFDIVKVIATTKPIGADVFRLGPAPRAVPAPQDAGDSLKQFLRESAQGAARSLTPVEVGGWVARERPLRVVRRAARVPSFALLYGSAAEATQARSTLSQSRAVCPGVAGAADPACLELAPMAGDPTIVEVRPPAARAADTRVGVGEAFEQAYALGAEARAARAEPLFDLELPRTPATPEAARSGGDDVDDPRAEADPTWSLKQVRAEEAWAKVRAGLHRPEGTEAQGIAIAHPDTGYTPHEEIWGTDPTTRPAWPEMGYDYYASDDDPRDELIDAIPGYDIPAHGTGSGSALVSPTGCQLREPACKGPSGIGRGARLVPLRVHRSVMHFTTARLSAAIRDAAGSDRSHVKVSTPLISISQGGVPSWTLWRAVEQAREHGVLIVAAAGNYVRTVVWPARFESVIAVAATNVGCRPWAHSSAGPAVDVSAPGESVWRATVDEQGRHVNGMSKGTTYATATTAGVAALWLALHGSELAPLRESGELSDTFRRLLRETAWQPGAAASHVPPGVACDPGPWDASRFGAGIVDARALLDVPVVPTALRTARPVSLQELPLFASLYPSGTSLEVIEDDYRQLFAVPATDLERVAIFEAEVTHHYATSEAVSDALDSVVISGQRSADSFARVRAALRTADLSPRLRNALP